MSLKNPFVGGGKPPRATSASIIRTVLNDDLIETTYEYKLVITVAPEGNTLNSASTTITGDPEPSSNPGLTPNSTNTVLSGQVDFGDNGPALGTQYSVSGTIFYQVEQSTAYGPLEATVVVSV